MIKILIFSILKSIKIYELGKQVEMFDKLLNHFFDKSFEDITLNDSTEKGDLHFNVSFFRICSFACEASIKCTDCSS